jgi:hypothetical protein
MERPQVADVGDGLQIWRITVNILNKQYRGAEKRWSSSLGVECVLTTPQFQENNLIRNGTERPGHGTIFYNLSKGK